MKQIELRRDSWHTKYYTWITRNDPPNGLCPYFWSMVAFIILSPIIVPVVSIVKLLIYFTERKLSEEDKELKNFLRKQQKAEQKPLIKVNWMGVWVVVGQLILGLFIMFMVFFVTLILISESNKHGVGNVILFILALLGGLSLLVLLIFGWMEGKVGNKIVTSKVISIPRAAIVGFYKKSCPRINWTARKH